MYMCAFSYSYQAQKRKLIVMPPPTPIHDIVAKQVGSKFEDALKEQVKINRALEPFWAVNTFPSLYEDAYEGSYQADMTMRYKSANTLLLEVEFKQPWRDLARKVERMLMEDRCWGVLVITVKEYGTTRLNPKCAMRHDSFMNESEWYRKALAMQARRPFGAVSIIGGRWTEGVTVDVGFFPPAWRVVDGLPPFVRLTSIYHSIVPNI